MDSETKELITEVAQGNLGALACAMALLQNDLQTGKLALETANEKNIIGAELYLLWNDVHNRDIVKICESLLLGTALDSLEKTWGSSFYLE